MTNTWITQIMPEDFCCRFKAGNVSRLTSPMTTQTVVYPTRFKRI
jgi:hypothetical protein